MQKFLFSAGLAILLQTLPLQAAPREPLRQPRGEDSLISEMGDMGKAPVVKAPGKKADKVLLKKFSAEYEAALPDPRPVFASYLPTLGAATLLDYLENKYPYCHQQSHELGKALFSASGNIGVALRECGTRCTSGCMHGVVGEAFGGAKLDDLLRQMNEFCTKGVMNELHKPGNCAHGLGHALMFVTDRDVNKSLDGCEQFKSEGMRYYCATGVYMELLLTGKIPDETPRPLHYPCDELKRYPAACYRYKGVEIRDALQGERDRFAEECLSLPGARRLGCFHGLGTAYMPMVVKSPALLPRICESGTVSDQEMCIEGAIEKLADYAPDKAEQACNAFPKGGLEKVCRQAAKDKMYSLTKSTLALYY